MFQTRSYSHEMTFFQRLRSFDFLLVFSVLLIGIISCFAMYSTDGGQFLYHTKSHILRFIVFFLMFLVLSLVRTKFWHSTGYFFYAIVAKLS